MEVNDMYANAGKAAVWLKAMANQHRLMILCLLNDVERWVSELNKQIAIPQSSLSQHLSQLRWEKLVATRRDAQTIYYSLASAAVQAIIATLYQVYCAPKQTA
jgi:DNA-binding transcriptional ArsR family regulator